MTGAAAGTRPVLVYTFMVMVMAMAAAHWGDKPVENIAYSDDGV